MITETKKKGKKMRTSKAIQTKKRKLETKKRNIKVYEGWRFRGSHNQTKERISISLDLIEYYKYGVLNDTVYVVSSNLDDTFGWRDYNEALNRFNNLKN